MRYNVTDTVSIGVRILTAGTNKVWRYYYTKLHLTEYEEGRQIERPTGCRNRGSNECHSFQQKIAVLLFVFTHTVHVRSCRQLFFTERIGMVKIYLVFDKKLINEKKYCIILEP